MSALAHYVSIYPDTDRKDDSLTYKKWSDDEVAFLKKHYPVKGRVWVAKKLNRTTGSVKRKLHDLGIRKSPEVLIEAERD